MASLLRNVIRSSCHIASSTAKPLYSGVDSLTTQLHRLSLISVTNRLSSSSAKDKFPDLPHLPNDGPYPKYEATPSPYKPPIWRRHGYNPNFYQGGILPRPDEFKDKPLPPGQKFVRKSWTKRSALFGQNDYIDILGDGELHPGMLTKGPAYMRGHKLNEYQRLLRQIRVEGEMLKEYYPRKYFDIQKRITFLYNRLNIRRRVKFWGGRNAWARSRFNNLDKIY